MGQPTGQVLLDSGSPYYGNFYYAQGSGMWDARNGTMLTKTGAAGLVSEGGANVVQSAGVGASPTIYTIPTPIVAQGNFTVSFKGRANVGSTQGVLFGSNSTLYSHFRVYTTSSFAIQIPFATSSYYAASLPASLTSDLAVYTLAVAAGGQIKFYKNKTLVTTLNAGADLRMTIDRILDGYTGGALAAAGVCEYLMILPFTATQTNVNEIVDDAYRGLIGWSPNVVVAGATFSGSSSFLPGVVDNASVTPLVATNEILISLPSGSETNYPYQFGRAFRKGEIVDTPQVLIDGVPTTTQADVKTRHRDGSVKFAVISVIIPTLTTTQKSIRFQNQAAPANTPVTIASMLANYDFEAKIDLKSAGTSLAGAPISARAMLATLTDSGLEIETTSGGVNSRYWTQGPICTTVILCNHTAKTWDVGTNATKALRPAFHVQFWPTINRYKVRFVVEDADVTKLKDETGLTVDFSTGNTTPVSRLNQTAVGFYIGNFQTRAYWGGTSIPRCNAKHGVAYMAETGVVQNFDPTIVINAASVADYVANFATRDQSLRANGYWEKGMANTGGRQDLGLMPKWDCVALFSGDAGMLEIAEKQSEFFGSFRFFWREGSPSKIIYGSQLGNGRCYSKLSRPTLFWSQFNGGDAGDIFTIDGTYANAPDGWSEENAHTPGAFWFQYLVSGEYIWHEKMVMLGAWTQGTTNPGIGYNQLANGASNTDLILNGIQVRGWGWQYRNLARAWWAAVDGSPEKSLLSKGMHDALAQRYGVYGIPSMVGDPIRDAWDANYLSWYAANGPAIPRPNALHYFGQQGAYSPAQFLAAIGSPLPDDAADSADALWMQSYVGMCLYHAVELGYSDAKQLADWVSYLHIQFANSSEPRHLGDYIIPQVKADGTYYQTLADMYDGYAHNADGAVPAYMPADSNQGFAAGGAPNTYTVTTESYASSAAAVIAMANGAPGQSSAWAVVKPWFDHTTIGYTHDPRYAIVPRVSVEGVVTVTINGVTYSGNATFAPGTFSTSNAPRVFVKVGGAYVQCVSVNVKSGGAYSPGSVFAKSGGAYQQS